MQNSRNKQVFGILCIVIAGLLWGVFPSFNRILYASGFDVTDTVSMRAFIAGVVYCVWGIVSGSFKNLKIKDMPFFFAYGMAAVFSTFFFYGLSIKYLSAAMSSILLYTAPAFVIIFSAIFYHEPITKLKLIALIMTFSGSFLVARGYDFSSLKLNFLGILFGLLSGIGYSMLTVIGRVALKKYTSLQNTFLPTMFVGLVFLFVKPPVTIAMRIPNVVCALCFLAIGVIGTVLPYFFYLKGLDAGVDGGNASLIANIEPLMATVCGSVFFSDPLELLQIIGIVVTLLGASLPVVFGPRSKSDNL